MKKIFLLFSFILLLSLTGRSQFSYYGFHVGGGYSYFADDIISQGGTMGVNLGAFVTYDFSSARSVLADRLYIQSGFNLVRRGGRDEAVFVVAEGITMIHRGAVEAWYAQIPVLASFRLELPVRKHGHFINAFVGPAFSLGLFGKYTDRSDDTGHESAEVNYRNEDFKVFSHIQRADVNILAGVGYQYKNFFVRAWIDRGFLAIDEGEDILRKLENEQTGENKSTVIPNANVVSYILALGYQIPIQH